MLSTPSNLALYGTGVLERFKNHSNIHFHLGDSADVLEKILPIITEPAVIYLYAQFSGGTTAYGRDGVPLLSELSVIAADKGGTLL